MVPLYMMKKKARRKLIKLMRTMTTTKAKNDEE